MFSVLVAARNEAENLPNLLTDLAKQSLQASDYEVIVIDDNSVDATAKLVLQAVAASPLTLRLIRLADQPNTPTGKKAALQAGLEAAQAPWVICTDADCRVGPNWLSSYAEVVAHAPEVRFVSGPVLLTGPESGWHSLTGVEFAGLVGVGAASIGAGAPTMCNGANLAYRRDAFAAVQGFAGNEHVPSGDDEFLLHKLHAAYPGSVRFLKNPDAIVTTAAPPTLAAFLAQRVRWASKWQHYQAAAPQRLAVLVLLANVALLMGLVLAIARPTLWPWVAVAWVLKLGSDAWFMQPVLQFFDRQRWLWWLLPLQVAYAPYALAVGLLGLRGGYSWKGRSVT
ncbi:glycosyltransferase [Hymenobacter sp. BT491]|uniref:glycosyltransferase n=1 Tax=Hymenobacter sp. BT491 TaxID=2766779 RepID=UPI001653A1F6|nr:glycosyltransferase [Hymenobacter sp. BT491]MBC6988888.1 glycosyltransferase [Hymenobacter sp. BT491]